MCSVICTCLADDVDEIGKEELQHLIHNSQLWDILSQDNKVLTIFTVWLFSVETHYTMMCTEYPYTNCHTEKDTQAPILPPPFQF